MDAPVAWIAAALLLGVPAYAWLASGRRVYATWGFIILALSLPGALVMHERLTAWAAPPRPAVARRGVRLRPPRRRRAPDAPRPRAAAPRRVPRRW